MDDGSGHNELINTLYARLGKALLDIEFLLNERKQLLAEIESLRQQKNPDGK